MKKKRTPVDLECVGKKLAEDIILNRKVLLSRGSILDAKDIHYLNKWGVRYLQLEADDGPDDDLDNSSDNSSDIGKEAEEVYFDSVREMERMFRHVRMGGNLHQQEVSRRAGRLVQQVLLDGKTLFSSGRIKRYDHNTYTHSVNVSIFAVATGALLGLFREELISLGTAALLHDVGKCFIPEKIVNKPRALNGDEWEIMRTHPQKGCDFLESQEFPSEICLVALQHHERLDGSGYPSGWTEESLHSYSQIVALVDLYDALTAARPYQDPFKPQEAVNIMREQVDIAFPFRVFEAFLLAMDIYPVGSFLVMESGEQLAVCEGDEKQPYYLLCNGALLPPVSRSRVIGVLLP